MATTCSSLTLEPPLKRLEMARLIPASVSGITSGRARQNIRNISAVHRPTPLILTSLVITSSSSNRIKSSLFRDPLKNCSASSIRHRAFEGDTPQLRSSSGDWRDTLSGLITPTCAWRRFQTALAARTDSCWPTIDFASAKKKISSRD